MRKGRLILALLGTAALVAGPLSVGPSLVGFDAAYAKNGGEGGKGNGGEGGKGNGGDRGKSGEAGGKKSGAERAASTGAGAGVSGKSKGKPTATASAAATKTNKGAIASQLKGLNAAHASAQAFANASPDSKVGQLRAYAEAHNAATAAQDAAAAAAAEVERLAALTPEEAALEFPDPVGYDQAAYDAALAEAQAAADLTEVERLQGLSTEDRATSYPSDWDPVAAQAEALAEATAAQTLADTAAAEAETLATETLAAAGGANLSEEAIDYLHGLLEGKVPAATTPAPVEEEAVLDEVAAEVIPVVVTE